MQLVRHGLIFWFTGLCLKPPVGRFVSAHVPCAVSGWWMVARAWIFTGETALLEPGNFPFLPRRNESDIANIEGFGEDI